MTKKPDREPKDRSKKETKKPDPKPKDRQSERIDIDDASKNWKDRAAKQPRQSKTAAIPMIMDDDDDDNLRILDDKDDKGYELTHRKIGRIEQQNSRDRAKQRRYR